MPSASEKKRKREEKKEKIETPKKEEVTNEGSEDEGEKKIVEKKKKEKKKVEKVVQEAEDSSDDEEEKERKRAKKERKEKRRERREKRAKEEAEKTKVEESQDKKDKKDKKEKKAKTEEEDDDEPTEEEVVDAATAEWRLSHNISILGRGCPPPIKSFPEASFPDYILSAIKTLKYDKPTPIQSQGWPLALGGRDMIGLAETGSGKTVAFMFPGIIHISNKPKAERKGPSVLVLAPTRELAQQIEDVTAKSCSAAGIKSVCIYGGVEKGGQARGLKGAEVIIATPGRLLDFMQDGAVKLNNVTYLVFDEADRMLDMGFEMQINQIMRDITSPNRQTLMFSATWPNDVQRLASKFFKKPVRITIGSENLSGAKRVEQIVEVCEPWEKKKKLTALLTKLFKNNCKILIFMLYKKSCEQMAVELERAGWPVVSIHGDKNQGARNQALADFKSSTKPILIATDVAARGLDIKEVKYVINVEFPLKCEDYVHRIGRTGRAGETGTAYTFFTADDKQHARELVQIMQESKQVVDDKMLALADKAPGIKPKKTALQELYGDFARGKDPALLTKKATKIVFDD